MTSIPDSRSHFPVLPQVNYEEPKSKPPPLLEVGVPAWVRHNLFRSTFDTVLTVVVGLLVASAIVGLVSWTIAQANWFVITVNLRQFMVGRFPADQLWRVNVMLLYLMVVVGFSAGTWSRLSRAVAVIVVALLALTFVVPPLTLALTPPPTAYAAAGNAPIQSGTITETPIPEVGFIGQQGEVVTVQVAPVSGDSDLTRLSGFTDRAANAVVNAAANRQAVIDERAEIEARLQSDLLSEAQRTDLSSQLAGLTIPDSVAETLAVNSQPAQVQILDGQTQNVLAEKTLTPGGEPLTLTLPASGWYLLHKLTQADQGVTLLRITGIAPLLVNQLTPTTASYRRMTDTFETDAPRPKIDGTDAPMMIVTDNQFAGERSFVAYMRLLVAPFFSQINVGFLLVVVTGSAGYAAARFLKGIHPPGDSDENLARRGAPLLWLISPIVVAVLIASVDPQRWGGLLLTFLLTAVGIVASFPIGVLLALGRRSSLPVVKAACIAFIELVRGVPLITILFMAQLMLPLLNPALQSFPNVLRAMVGITLFSAAYLAENVRGGLQSVPHGQEEAAKALGLSSFHVTLFITLPQALRAVIPALVGQAIALFKDTSLVAIVGLFDLLKIADSTVAQTEFIGTRAETYLFISIIYFAFSYIMGYISRRVEVSGSGAARKI